MLLIGEEKNLTASSLSAASAGAAAIPWTCAQRDSA